MSDGLTGLFARLCLPIATPPDRALRRPLESALAALVGVVDQSRRRPAPGERHLQRVDDEL
jgi:hypothetical protein